MALRGQSAAPRWPNRRSGGGLLQGSSRTSGGTAPVLGLREFREAGPLPYRRLGPGLDEPDSGYPPKSPPPKSPPPKSPPKSPPLSPPKSPPESSAATSPPSVPSPPPSSKEFAMDEPIKAPASVERNIEPRP